MPAKLSVSVYTIDMKITLQRRIGSGGNGTVYLGRDEDVDRDVAVKFFDNSFDSVRTQVNQHVVALKQIQHENVVAIFGVATLRRLERAEGPDEVALVMEYVPGDSFGEWLNRPEKTKEELETVCYGILDGLCAFHDKKLAHGDLHVGNLRVAEGVAKILDPMEHDPQSVKTTALTQDRMEADVRAAMGLLVRATRDLALSREAIELLTIPDTPPRTLRELKELFRQAMEVAGMPGTDIDAAVAFYRVCAVSQIDNSGRKWHQVRKEGRSALGAGLERWRSGNPAWKEQIGGRSEQIYSMLQEIGKFCGWQCAAAEIGVPTVNNDVLEAGSVLVTEWPSTGFSSYVEAPQSFFYFIYYIVGACGMLGSKPEQILAVANQVMRDRGNPRGLPIWRRPQLVGWPPCYHPQEAMASWKVLREAYTAVPLLREVFVTENAFFEAITSLNLAMSVILFSATDPEAYSKPDGTLHQMITVPPNWLDSTEREVIDAWRRLKTSGVGKVACALGGLQESEGRKLWPAYSKKLATLWASGRRIPFGYDHLPAWVWTDAPF